LRRLPTLLVLALAALCAPGASPAAPPASPPTSGAAADSALVRALESLGGQPLSLDDALAAAHGEATAIREATAARDAAAGSASRERGAFDPVLFGSLKILSDDVPAASPFSGADVVETRERRASAGARWKLPIGTEFRAVLESSRLESNSSFASLEPEITTSGRLEMRQPLLKGFGPAASGDRTSAKATLAAADSRLDDAIRTVDADVTGAYWDLYAAERDLAVQRLIVERGEAFLQQADRRTRAGLGGPDEMATARAFLAEQRIVEIDREEGLEAASDRLSSLLGVAQTERFHPVTEPSREIDVESEETVLERALSAHDGLVAARRDLEAREAEASAARWDALPSLDVTGSVGGNGLGGTPQPVDFGGATILSQEQDSYGGAIGEALSSDYPSWSVGVELEVPLGSREGRGERDRRRAEVERAQQRVIALERSVREDVRARHRELRHGVRRLELARASVDASLEQVRIAAIEYDNGRTTAFELVRLAADLATAQQRYSDALVRTAKARAELRRLAPSPAAAANGGESR
jgi:outer membrane protein